MGTVITERQATFGESLRRYRIASGLTQEQLAEQAHMSRRAISDLERGVRTKPWRRTVELLADALGLTLDERTALEEAIDRFRKSASVSSDQHGAQFPPREVTPLVGREHDEADIVHLLRQDHVRLLTLTGAGGVGKTRLAFRVAASEGDAYSDGVRFVSLGPLRDDRYVVTAIAAALGLQETRGLSLDRNIERFLQHRRLLLVLDNFEHVLGAAPVISQLLAACPELTILVTSREPLHLRGEQEFEVPSLATAPTAEIVRSADDLRRYPACVLFLSRACGANARIHISDSDAMVVNKICHRLDGLPLAIELAAAQLKYETPLRLLERLQRQFEVLVAGAHDMPARHQTMRDCVAWSFDLLNPSEQDVLCWLGVFVGGCTLEAIQIVLRSGGIERTDVEATIRSLVDKSLVVIDWADKERTRFTMAETIRQFALERLEERGQTERAHAAYAQYFLFVAEQAESAIWRPKEVEWLRRLAFERDNLRAVLAWTLHHDVELGLKIAGDLRRFWNHDGYFGERRSWFEHALALGAEVTPEVRVKALSSAGWLALCEGDVAASLNQHREALRIARTLRNDVLVWQTAIGLAFAELSHGDVEVAATLFQEGVDISRELGTAYLRGSAVYGLGLTYQVRGDLGRAFDCIEESVKLFRAQGECISIGSSLRALAGITLVQEKYPEALKWFQDGLRAAVFIRHQEGIATSLEGIAAILAAGDQLERAGRLWGAAEAVHEKLHGPPNGGDVPFARLLSLSPHLRTITAHFNKATWNAATALGHKAPLTEAIADALDVK